MFGHIFGGYPLKFTPYIGLIYGRYLHFRILKFPLIMLDRMKRETSWNAGFRADAADICWCFLPARPQKTVSAPVFQEPQEAPPNKAWHPNDKFRTSVTHAVVVNVATLIKHGLLENPPFVVDFPSSKLTFIGDIQFNCNILLLESKHSWRITVTGWRLDLFCNFHLSWDDMGWWSPLRNIFQGGWNHQ